MNKFLGKELKGIIMKQIKVNCISKEFKTNKPQKNNRKIKNFFDSSYTTVNAVNNISFEITKGESIGFIGPNGAGKSTTIKMLTGILLPTSGDIQINGRNPYYQRRKFLEEVGVVFGQRSQLWWDLPVIDSYKLLKSIYHISHDTYNDNLTLFTDVLDIGNLLHKPVRQMSLGQRMRCEIAASFLHNPNIVYLDEPTIGLDTLAKENIRHFIKTVNMEKKVTIFLTTHDLSDIENLCNRIIIIDKGSIVYESGIEQIKNFNGKRRYMKIDLKDDINILDKRITVIADKGRSKQLSFLLDEINIAEVLDLILSQTEIVDVDIHSTPIEDIVKEIYKRNDLGDTICL